MELKEFVKRLFVPALRPLDQGQFARTRFAFLNRNRVRRCRGYRVSRQWSFLNRSVEIVTSVLWNASENI